MASPISSVMSSSSSCSTISDDDFNLFHSIDRELYSILISYLCRDPIESMQVMALWLWLERAGHDSALVKKLLSIPVTLVNTVADETVTCLKCIETDDIPIDPEENDIPTLQRLLKNCVSFRYFHENRLTVLRAVRKITNEVCVRAFKDILKNTFQNNLLFGGYRVGESSVTTLDNDDGNVSMVPVGYYQSLWTNHSLPLDIIGESHTYDTCELVMQCQILNNELDELEEKKVAPDDRSMFLTFSRGYPISESEVRDFFSANFGDFIEAIYMQEVAPDKQALYARVVVHSVSTIDVVLNGQRKVKFTLNGKHVWMRKYVPKNP